MEDLNTLMADTFRQFMGPYYRMCPEESKSQYKEILQDAMQHAESVIDIEKKIQNGEITPSFKCRTTSVAHYKICMKKLRNLRR